MMISHYGGLAGLRDDNMLESALVRPRQLFHYGKPEMSNIAAAYAAGILKNHPFLDGNKRTGFMLGAGFLERNGFEFRATEVDMIVRTLPLGCRGDDRSGLCGMAQGKIQTPLSVPIFTETAALLPF